MVERTYNQPAHIDPNTGLWGSDEHIPPDPSGLLVINGTGFDVKGRSTPNIWENFENATNGQLLKDYDPSWQVLGARPLGAYITTENVRYAGGKAAGNKFYRGEFETNFKRFPQSRKYFISYWMRIQGWQYGKDYGALKFCRVNSSTEAGGGGDYNGEGDTGLNNAVTWNSPEGGGYANCNDAAGNYISFFWPLVDAIDTWVRVEQEQYLSDLDVANGYFRTLFNETLNNIVQNRMSRTTAINFQKDTCLLGLMPANSVSWKYPTDFTVGAVYSVTINSVVSDYIVQSGDDRADICAGIVAAITANALSAQVSQDGQNFGLFPNYIEKLFSANIATNNDIQPAQLVMDVYLEAENTARFVVGDNANYDLCTIREMQPYTSWEATTKGLKIFAPTIVGDKHLHFISDAGAKHYYGVLASTTGAINWSI